jgi:hypothetical protein
MAKGWPNGNGPLLEGIAQLHLKGDGQVRDDSTNLTASKPKLPVCKEAIQWRIARRQQRRAALSAAPC